MAAKGGGSWKVAYADFVTAMMAFFLVMWIGSQDTKTKQAVANYFIDPAGVSKRPSTPGSVTPTPSHGSVPNEEATAVGKGRTSYTEVNPNSPLTKMVSDSIFQDERALQYWRDQANKQRADAAESPEVVRRQEPIMKVAADALAKRLREEFSQKVAPQNKGVYQNLLFSTLKDVTWVQIAEDLLAAS
jgi:flagellar motor protein MotB